MCQLLGMNCNTPTDIVFSFTGFATRGGRTDEHKDGWGIAFFEGKGVRHFVDHQAAIDSPIAELIKRYPIKSTNVIAHIRKATQGVIALENCHPFIREAWGCQWVFAHNGDLKDFEPQLDGSFLPIGSTDSERAFCYIMQCLRTRFGMHMPTLEELRTFLAGLCNQIAKHGTFNMMLSNGGVLFAHCSTKLHYIERQHPFNTAALSDEDVSVDFAQVTTPKDRVAVIVTEPLTSNEHWTAIQSGEMKVFVDGRALV
ncbi:class II glutamine amidotransferase [Undibacterium fentianense]|uniref:Class II glutamine amidotransferase n=1 Tax=Undibacterium fentianense TaxID=2828728 RepID=A0A941IE50_9BURK|nr:class II glutamine amidotransferase [Undibacterium fentianense]MBR7800703.1 class II glutamine amidotransferase [Undibacterium fentianense]